MSEAAVGIQNGENGSHLLGFARIAEKSFFCGSRRRAGELAEAKESRVNQGYIWIVTPVFAAMLGGC